MSNTFVPSGRGAAIIAGGGTSSGLVSAYEYIEFYDTATIQEINGLIKTILPVVVTGFTVNVRAYPELSCTSIGDTIVFSGMHTSTFYDTWVSRNEEKTQDSTTSIGVGAWPTNYYAGYRYVPDPTPATSVTWTIFTNLGTFSSTQRIINNRNSGRDYVRPFVRMGQMEMVSGNNITSYSFYTSTTLNLNVSGITILSTATGTTSKLKVDLSSKYTISTGQLVSMSVLSSGIGHYYANGYYTVESVLDEEESVTSFTYNTLSVGQILTSETIVIPASSSVASSAAIVDRVYNVPAANTTDYVTFTVPAFCSSISVVCIGGGGAAGGYTILSGEVYRGGGGGGGGLRYRNNIPVTAGEVIRIHVGAGGAGVSTGSGGAGDQSFVARNDGTVLVSAGGGGGGPAGTPTSSSRAAGGKGTAQTSTIGGGDGGQGGPNAVTGTFAQAAGGGGGGAGGYGNAGNSPSLARGGDGAAANGTPATAGLLGAGGGGATNSEGVGGGGGVGLYGRGSNGAAGVATSSSGGYLYAGGRGSGGVDGEYYTEYGVTLGSNRGFYGSGAWGIPAYITGTSRSGRQGAVRIIAGGNRSFPTSAFQLSEKAGNSSYTVTSETTIVVDTPLEVTASISYTTFTEDGA